MGSSLFTVGSYRASQEDARTNRSSAMIWASFLIVRARRSEHKTGTLRSVLRHLRIVGACLFFACASVTAAPRKQFIHVAKRHGIWWLISPSGHRFICKAVDSIEWFPTRKDSEAYQAAMRSPNFPHLLRWGEGLPDHSISAKEHAIAQLLHWGFNTVGAWSENLLNVSEHGRGMYATPVLSLGQGFTREDKYCQKFPDVFSPMFRASAYRSAKIQCSPFKNNPKIIGWYSDNELRWGADWRGKNELLTVFLDYPISSPGHHSAVEFLRRRYHNSGGIIAFDRVWRQHFASWKSLGRARHIVQPYLLPRMAPSWPPRRSVVEEMQADRRHPGRARFVADCYAFLGRVAMRYFHTCRDAIKAADPNHLYLGAKDVYVPPPPVLKAETRYCDVLSVDLYGLHVDRKLLRVVGGKIGDVGPSAQGGVLRQLRQLPWDKPFIIGEFSFRARDSGLPNTNWAGPLFNTQQQRAVAMTSYVHAVLGMPNCVGYSWYEYVDEPSNTPDHHNGENSNYGLLTRYGVPYIPLVEAFTRVNARAVSIHESALK
ncbi:MAG: hypothetical protein ACP5I8_14240 [Phycisphaerae bacterium]